MSSAAVRRLLEAPSIPILPAAGGNERATPDVRRAHLYTPWTAGLDSFLTLRARGLPVLTAYYLTNPSNMHRTWQAVAAEAAERGSLEHARAERLML